MIKSNGFNENVTVFYFFKQNIRMFSILSEVNPNLTSMGKGLKYINNCFVSQIHQYNA